MKQWRLKNKEYDKEYYKKIAEIRRAYQRNYKQKHKDKLKEYDKIYNMLYRSQHNRTEYNHNYWQQKTKLKNYESGKQNTKILTLDRIKLYKKIIQEAV